MAEMTVFGFQDQDIKGIMLSFLFLSLSYHFTPGKPAIKSWGH